MEKIWKSAFAVAGIGGVAFFVFYLLNKQLLTMPVFERLTPTQTFAVMMTFLVLVFGSLVAGVMAWLRKSAVQTGLPARPALVATRDFFVGRWEVQQKIPGVVEGGTYTDYFENGMFAGHEDQFVDGQGRRSPIKGTWTFTALSKDEFSLTLNYDNRSPWQGIFRIVDSNRIHNIDINYDAVRVVR